MIDIFDQNSNIMNYHPLKRMKLQENEDHSEIQKVDFHPHLEIQNSEANDQS